MGRYFRGSVQPNDCEECVKIAKIIINL
jgi:hypothetical protein